MGYYFCRKCEDFFQIDYRTQPLYCKNCRTVKHLKQIQRKTYRDWLQMRKDAETYQELQDDIIWEYCKIIWDAYDTRYKFRSI